jgi:trimethylamine-N-oxide reductase cytochrome c-type subunit TorC
MGNSSERGVYEEGFIELAKHEWDRFSANKSLECKNCHNYESMDFEQMSPTARIQMKQAAEKDQSCVDCHKGIAHKLPAGMDSIGGIVGELEQLTSSTDYSVGNALVSVRHLPVYFDETGAEEAGLLNPASTVTVLEDKGEMMKVEIDGWRKAKGFGRVIQEDFGMNIAVGSLLKEAATSDDVVTKGEKKVDELTGLPWEKVAATVWMKKEAMLNDVTPIWEKASEAYKTNCSVCHTQPDEAHFDANTWPGMFNGMLAFVNFDTDSEALVLKYLQKHSSDFAEGHH